MENGGTDEILYYEILNAVIFAFALGIIVGWFVFRQGTGGSGSRSTLRVIDGGFGAAGSNRKGCEDCGQVIGKETENASR